MNACTGRLSLFALFYIIATVHTFAQNVRPFKDIQFDSTYVIVGIGPHDASLAAFQKFDFMLDKVEDLNALKSALILTKKTKGALHQNYYNVLVLKNHEIVESLTISPSYQCVNVKGTWYEFDTSLLTDLHNRFPLYYRCESKDFEQEEDLKPYYAHLKEQPNFMFKHEPLYKKYAGSFYVTFNKSEKFKDFKIATTYLDKELAKLSSRDKFIAGYELSDYNLNHPSRFQVTVHADRKTYEKLQGTNYEKGEWTDRVLKVTSLWRESVEHKQVQFDTDSVFKGPSIDAMPEYPGGIEGFYKFIGSNFRYPVAAIEAGVSGRMVATFVVEKDGSLSDIHISNDLGYGTGNEMIKLLKSSMRWKPGLIFNEPVRVQYTLPVMLQMAEDRRGRYPPTNVLPPGYSILPEIKENTEPKLPPVSVTRAQYVFPEQTGTCLSNFTWENEKVAFSDRYSIVQILTDAIPQDSLKKLTGRVSLQVLIDTTGSTCLLSKKSEVNIAHFRGIFEEALAKTKWTLYPVKGNKEPVSVILALTFSAHKVKYQHLAFKPGTDILVELEQAERAKFSKY